jgi:hypothetical protein
VIAVLVTFTLPGSTSRAQAIENFNATAPRYRGMAGLACKYYVVGEATPSGTPAGGLYIWNSRADAEAVYTKEWIARVTERYGVAPRFTWYDAPVIVDNLHAVGAAA